MLRVEEEDEDKAAQRRKAELEAEKKAKEDKSAKTGVLSPVTSSGHKLQKSIFDDEDLDKKAGSQEKSQSPAMSTVPTPINEGSIIARIADAVKNKKLDVG